MTSLFVAEAARPGSEPDCGARLSLDRVDPQAPEQSGRRRQSKRLTKSKRADSFPEQYSDEVRREMQIKAQSILNCWLHGDGMGPVATSDVFCSRTLKRKGLVWLLVGSNLRPFGNSRHGCNRLALQTQGLDV